MFDKDKVWDPLNTSIEDEPEIVSAAKKRLIKNILKSYVGMYDPFSELIQNAMDAVDNRAELQEKDYEKKIWITVDLPNNSFSIVDNGIGFSQKEFRSFLAPNISYKNDIGSRGNKGVGVTYIAYGFDYLQFGTKSSDFEFVAQITDGRKWVEDAVGVVSRPVVQKSETKDEYFQRLDRGSFFKLKFSNKNYSRPKNLSWYTAETPEQWRYLLLVKTPLGSIINLNVSRESIPFSLTVINNKGESNTIDDLKAEYIYPHKEISASKDLKEILAAQQKLLDLGKDVSKLPSKFYKLTGVYEYLTESELLALPQFSGSVELSELIKKYSIEAYAYFTYSTGVWTTLNDNVAKLRKGYRILKGGLQLANNSMPQGEMITIPLTSNIGHQNQTHVIVHFKNADPDLGRKGFQPELQDVAEKISVALVNRLNKRKHFLKIDTGVRPDLDKEKELHEWIKEQENHEKKNPLLLKNENFFRPLNEISITSVPQSEQDVIVLFNQLIAGGVIRGIKLLATSQIKQYDGIFKFFLQPPFENHIFDKENNPLGVESARASKSFESIPKILEYKFNLDALIDQFDSGDKVQRDINLAITWEMGSRWEKYYEIISLLNLENIHQREFHGITHELVSDTSRFYVIALQELIDYLNDINGVQDFQKTSYSDE